MKEQKDWTKDETLTAYALGELNSAEAEAFEVRIEGDHAAQDLVQELRELGAMLEHELAGEELSGHPGLRGEQLAAIEERLDSGKPAARTNSYRGLALASLAAALVAVCFGGYRFLRPMPSVDSNPQEVAKARQRSGLSKETIDALNELGYAGATNGSADSGNAFHSQATAPEEVRSPTSKHSTGLGYSEQLLDSLGALGYGGGGATGTPGATARYDLKQVQLAKGSIVLGRNGIPSQDQRRFSRSGPRGPQSPTSRALQQKLRDLGYIEEEEEDQESTNAGPGLDGEAYQRIYENPFRRVSEAPLSTFSVDVDSASYSNMRRFLNDDSLPPADAIRIEELINYFPYAYDGPTDEHPFSVNTEVGSAPWAPTHRLVRIGLQAKRVLPAERRGSNLVFLLDVSGSMNSADKLPLLKKALHLLVQQLDERDTISIVVYAGASGLALPATRCDTGVQIHMALERLQAGGSTHGSAGIELAYRIAKENYIQGGINRVILGTDGDFNVGISSDGALTRLIEEKAKSGVFLSVLGFGRGNLQDAKMEQLADRGNGHYAYIDTVLEARKVLVEELGATLETVAKDVKLQVEFNPTLVQAYRLLGYENRMLATRDFNDDTKDAGEIGAGHSVTALYELIPVGVPMELPIESELRYQQPRAEDSRAFSNELLNVALRYKKPDEDTSKLFSTPVPDANVNFTELSNDTRWAASVAAFGMLLRGSQHSGNASLSDVTRWAAESLGDDPGGYRAQFIGLVGKARQLRGE